MSDKGKRITGIRNNEHDICMKTWKTSCLYIWQQEGLAFWLCYGLKLFWLFWILCICIHCGLEPDLTIWKQATIFVIQTDYQALCVTCDSTTDHYKGSTWQVSREEADISTPEEAPSRCGALSLVMGSACVAFHGASISLLWKGNRNWRHFSTLTQCPTLSHQ